MDTGGTQKIFRAAAGAIIPFVLIELMFAGIAVYMYRNPKIFEDGIIPLTIACAFLTLLFANQLYTRIVLTDYSITFRKLAGSRTFTFSEITRIETVVKAHVTMHGVTPDYRIVLYSYDKGFRIPFGMFPKKAVAATAQMLIGKCKSARIDEDTRKLAEGKWPTSFSMFTKRKKWK